MFVQAASKLIKTRPVLILDPQLLMASQKLGQQSLRQEMGNRRRAFSDSMLKPTSSQKIEDQFLDNEANTRLYEFFLLVSPLIPLLLETRKPKEEWLEDY